MLICVNLALAVKPQNILNTSRHEPNYGLLQTKAWAVKRNQVVECMQCNNEGNQIK